MELIGKEANRWDEQVYLGTNPEAQIVYGSAREDLERRRRAVLDACQAYSLSALARKTGLDRTTIRRMLTGRSQGAPAAWDRLYRTLGPAQDGSPVA